MALAAYERWMALEQCEKYRLISDERSAMMARMRALMPGEYLSVGGPVVTLEEQEEVMHVMARVGDNHASMGGPVVTLEEQEAVMHVMALEQYEKCLAVRIEARLSAYECAALSRVDALRAAAMGGPPAGVDQDPMYLDEARLDVAEAYNNIAGIYKAQGKYEMAVEVYEDCLMTQRMVLGANNLDVAKTYHKIACMYYAQKKYEMALEQYEKCLAIRIAVSGENHVDVFNTTVKMEEVRIRQHYAGLRATAAVLRRALRAQHCAARARNFALHYPELF
jgi:tetratricopeptide (TPR) repeat protein